MTNDELKLYNCYKVNIERNNSEIEKIRDKAEKCTSSISGMPMSSGTSDKVGSLDVDMIKKLEAENDEFIKKAKAIEDFIEAIPNLFDKTIFKLKYIDGLRWKEVADIVKGGNTYSSLSERCYKYLRNTECS